MAKILEKEASKVNFNKYSDYRISVLLSYSMAMLYNIFNIDIVSLNCNLGMMATASSVICFIDRMQKNSKEMMNLKTLYRDYVNRIASLNRELGIDDDIVKMSELFFNMYYFGYLSNNKEYTFSADNVLDLEKYGLMGAEIVRGIGVCRHISRLFSDVASENGYDVDIVRSLTLDTDRDSSNQIFLMKLREISEELQGLCKNEDLFNDLNLNNISFETVKDRCIREFGNHELIGAYYNGEYLIIDPTNNEYCFPISSTKDNEETISNIKKITGENRKLKYPINEQTILIDTSCAFSVLRGIVTNKKTNKNVSYYKVKERIDKLKTTKEDLLKKREEVLKLIEENDDRFEKFYEDNKELYSEINNSMKGLRLGYYEKN